MQDYPGYISEPGSHTLNCSRCNVNKRRVGINLCQSCIDYLEFHEHFEEIKKLNSKSTKKRQSILRKKEILDTLQKQMEAIKILIRDDNLELQTIDKILFLEEQSIQLSAETVSEDVRKYRAYTDDEKLVVLETHCTIVRPEKSQENVYFGHVTLIITINGVDYKCRYGIEMYNKLPESLDHQFWRPSENGISHTRLIHDFGKFYMYFPKETTLSDIMISHFRDCYKAFNRSQWSDQIWEKTDKIKDEPAPKLLKRLRKEEPNRHTLGHDLFIDRELRRLRQDDESKVKLKVKDRLPTLQAYTLADYEAREEEAREEEAREEEAREEEAREEEAREEEVREEARLAREREEEAREEEFKRLARQKLAKKEADRIASEKQSVEAKALAKASKEAAEKEERGKAEAKAVIDKAKAEAKAAKKAAKKAAPKKEVSVLQKDTDPDDEELEREIRQKQYNVKLAIDSINTIIDKLQDSITILKFKEEDLSKTKNTEEKKQIKLVLIDGNTKLLEEVNENIEDLDTFTNPNLPVDAKKEARDILVKFKKSLKNTIRLLEKENPDLNSEQIDIMIENLKQEVYEEVYEKEEKLAQMDSSTDDDTEALSSLIAKLNKSLEKVKENEQLLETNTNLSYEDVYEVLDVLERLSARLESKIHLYEGIRRYNFELSNLITNEKKLSKIQDKTVISKRRRELILEYTSMIELHNKDLISVSTSEFLSEKDKECMTAIFVRFKLTKEIRLANLKKLEADYLRSLIK